MKQVRIAVVSDAVLPFNKGGKETRIYYLTQQLASLGYQVDVYTMQWWETGKTYKHDGIQYHAISRFHPLYAGQRRSIAQAVIFSLSCLKMLFYDFDILEVDHMPFFPLFTGKLVCMIKRRPLYATWHEVWGRSYWQEYLGTFKGSLAYIVEKLSVKLPDHIITISRHTERRLRERLKYKGKLSLITHAIDVRSIAAVQPASQKSDIIYTGRLLAHKHVDLLIKAVARIAPAHPDLRCVIIGDGPERERLQSLIHELGLADTVQMLGFVKSSETVLAHMKSSKVFVLPSTREGFGISVLEAFGCGLRVITFDHPDNAARDLVPAASGNVCQPTVISLAKALEAELAKYKNSAADTDHIHMYDWGQSAKRLSEVYAL